MTKEVGFGELNAGLNWPALQRIIAVIDSFSAQCQDQMLQVEATGEEIKGLLVATCLFE